MIYVSDTIIENRLTSAQSASAPQVAPLYIYDDKSEVHGIAGQNLPQSETLRNDAGGWVPNFNREVLEQLCSHFENKKMNTQHYPTNSLKFYSRMARKQ